MAYLYHHCTELKSVQYGVLRPSPRFSCKDFVSAYQWLEEEVGFYPLFLSVGSTYDDIRMTGYDNQWRKNIGSRPDGTNIIRKKGEFPNYVLFSFERVEGVFTDYMWWHEVLNGKGNEKLVKWQPSAQLRRMLFKPSYGVKTWLRFAKRNPHTVQLVTHQLDLRTAKRVWVRNEATKGILEHMGFANVRVKRIKLLV